MFDIVLSARLLFVIEMSAIKQRRAEMLDAAQTQLDATTIDPAPLLEVASGFMAAKHLFAAAELQLFAALGQGPASIEEIAARIGIPARTARVAADAMVALGFVERDGGYYGNGDVADAFLSGRGPADLRPLLRFWDRISYPNWANLAEALRTSEAARTELTDEQGEIYSAGVEAITAGTANALADTYDFSVHGRILDVGGGTGSFLVAALDRHPALRGTLAEIEPTLSVARQRIAAGPHTDRIEVIGADALGDPLPEGHDALLVANLAHLFSPEHNRQLFRRLRQVAPPGARLLLVDFWTDPGHTDPPFAALMAGEFLLVSGEGDVYSEAEIRDWLTDSGWMPIERRPLAGPQSLIVAAA
jgi:SAM-dependent methyltransferase